MAIRQTKKISDLPALSPASLDTTFVVGISGSTTYKISINNLTSSLDTTFATDLVTNALSSSLNSKLSTSSFNSYTSSFTASVASGTISGSSQLTSSFDTRYVVSGSITQTTWDNIANKPSGIVSQSTDLSSLNTFTASISTASLVTSIDNLNTFTASQSTSSLVNRLNAIESVSGSWITESETGSFLTSLSGAISSSTQISDLGFVTGSYTTINSFNSLTQSFNSISQSFNVISGSVGTVDFNGVVSGSSQLTSSYDTRYTLSGSVQPLPSNLLSSSAQITAFGFVSGSYETTGRGIISSSANLVTTSSFNSYTASISTASLVTSISNLNSATSSYLTSLSGAISSSSQITTLLPTGVVSGSAQTIANLPTGLISGSSQLTSAFPSKTTGTWSVPAGASTQSFTVEAGASYTMWVNGNIPNGIITWNATVTTANTNVPVVGSQHGWYYSTGNALVLTSMPDQITGTNGSIVNTPSAYAPNTSNVFKFGITNNSGASQTINYGYIKLS